MAKGRTPPSPQPAADGEMPADIAAMRYEAALGELESIVQKIEDGEIELEEALAAHRRATLLLRRCREILDAAQSQVERIAGQDLPAAAGEDSEESG